MPESTATNAVCYTTSRDTIARRLRRDLDSYYLRQGKDDAIRFRSRRGYAAEFRLKESDEAMASSANSLGWGEET